MTNRQFPKYPNDTDYTTNSPSYYDDLARKQHLIKLLAERIWEYEKTLDESLEHLEQRLTDYILQNDALMTERLENWDQRIDEMPEEMRSLFVAWLEDGTLEQIINHDVLGNKADKSFVDSEIERLEKKDEGINTLVASEIERLDKKDENLTTMKADKTFVNSEISRLDEEDKNINTKLTRTSTQADFAGTEVSKKIDKNVGAVSENDLSQQVKEIINGDRPLPIAEINSILTENIVDKQITRDKLSDGFTHNIPWIEDADANLNIFYNSGTYVIDSGVKENPLTSLGVMDVVSSRTQKNMPIYRVIQILYPLNASTIYHRGFSIDTDTGELIGNPSIWTPILNDRVKMSDLNGFTSKGIASDVHIDTLIEEGTYFIGSDVEGNPYRSSILTVELVYAVRNPSPTSNFWGIQRVTNVNSPNEVSVRYFRQVQQNLEFREWKRIGTEIDSDWAVDSQWANKKYVAFGTSLLANDGINDGRGGYADYVSNTLGTNFENRGKGSGGITKSASAGDTTMQRVKELADQPDDIDLITVEVRANDHGVPIGELGDTSQDTWYGALDMLCKELRKGTSARVVLITSTPARRTNVPGAEDRTPYVMYGGIAERDKAVEEVGAVYGFPVLNPSKKSGIMSYANDQTYVDHIHLSELGAEIVGRYIAYELLNINPMPDGLNRI